MIRSQSEIYERLESAFEKADKPLTCVELMDIHEVRTAAIDRWGKDVQEATEKLSDTLGFMWRRGVIERYPAEFNASSKARFAYGRKELKANDTPIPPKIKTKAKADLVVTEKDGEVIIQLDKFTIVIKPN
jgi:hypothetical protein